MMTTLWILASYIASLAILAMVVERFPYALARLAFVRVGDEIRLPVPSSALASLEIAPDEKTTYREAPTRELTLASFPGEPRVTREEEIVRFLPERGCLVVRRRMAPGLGSILLVRIDVSAVQGCLRLRARYLPADEMLFFLVAGCWLSAPGSHSSRPFWLVTVAVIMALNVVKLHRAARQCLDAAVDEIRRRIAAADPNDPHAIPAASETPSSPQQRDDDERLPWTCACGKENEVGRKTCRRCWAPRNPSA